MRFKSLATIAVAALLLCNVGDANAQQTIAWGDFSAVANPAGGSGGPYAIDNTVDGGSLTFDTSFIQWDTDNSTVDYFASAGTSNSAFAWGNNARSLIGFRDSTYSVIFDNISSTDGSLYLGAGAFEGSNTLSLSAFDSAGNPVSLVGSSVVGDWSTLGTGGIATWNPTTSGGSFSTPGGGNGGLALSGLSAVIDLSGLGISRLDATFATDTGEAVSPGDRWHLDLASNVSSIPEPSSVLLIASLAGFAAVKRRRKS